MTPKESFRAVVRAVREKEAGNCNLLNCIETRRHVGVAKWKCPECGRTRENKPVNQD